jgi:ABC-2 type transport system ATP-binding protein
VIFADESTIDLDPRLTIIKDEGLEKTIQFNHEEIGVAEAITLITRKYNITDISIKEPEIEEIVRDLYENISR